jgi:hypothetical protein
LPWRDVERDGSYVRFEALPMRPNAASLTEPDARIVGMGPAIGGLVDSHERLKVAGTRSSVSAGREPHTSPSHGLNADSCRSQPGSQALLGEPGWSLQPSPRT